MASWQIKFSDWGKSTLWRHEISIIGILTIFGGLGSGIIALYYYLQYPYLLPVDQQALTQTIRIPASIFAVLNIFAGILALVFAFFIYPYIKITLKQIFSFECPTDFINIDYVPLTETFKLPTKRN